MTRTHPRLDELLAAADVGWRDFRSARGERFHGFIPADPRDAWEALIRERSTSASFLELGAGMGVIAILADWLGYDAWGIEIVPELVTASRDLAERFDSGARFIEGSFVPPAFRDEIELLSADFLTLTEGADAYDEMGMSLADFDLVYAYPWPGEEDWLAELVRREAGPHTRLLTYSVSDGFVVA